MAITVTEAGSATGTIIYANAAFEALTGFPAAEVMGRSDRLLHAEETDRAVLDQLHAAVAQTGAGTAEVLNRRKDGTRFWNRISVTTIRDAEGSPAFSLATLAEVTGGPPPANGHAGQQHSRPKLDEARARLRQVQVSAAAAGAWEWDIATNRLVVDARFASIYGLEPATAELPASAFFKPIHDDDRMRMRIAVAGALQGAEVFARDFRVVVGGEVRWVAARGRTYLDDEEKPLRFAGVLTDISEQRKVEERLYIAQTAGGVGSFEYLSGYGTAEVSEEFCRLLGLRPALTLPVRTINAVVHPDDEAIIQNRDGQIREGAAFHECRITRADTGEERWLASRGEYRRAVGGGVIFAGVIYDVTTIKRSEAQLRLLTESLEERVELRTQERDRVWNLSRDLLNVIGPDGLQRSVNPAWTTLLGFEASELLGSSMDALVHPDDLAIFAVHLTALRRGELTADFDIRLRSKDGTYRWVSWTAMVQDETIYGIGRDVTQRKLLEEQLRQSQKMEAVGQLTGGLAHDFNNMLTGILGGIDMARRRIQQGRLQDVDRYLDAAVTSGQRAAALTHRLLAFSRRQTLDSRPLDVSTLVRSVEDLLRRSLGERIELTIDADPDLWPALADESQLESAILNLAINARDAMPEGGQLTIRLQNAHFPPETLEAKKAIAGDFVQIRVADTGCGMPPEVLARVFDPFYTTKPVGQGTGLGLSMIYGFVQQSRGHIQIASDEGKGTAIHLLLPRYDGDLPLTREVESEPPLSGTGETVLVVEDDPAVRLIVLQSLKELGYHSIETQNGKEAVPILQSNRKIDLLVTDVGLPGLNGRQIADIGRESRPHLPVLFMTGYAMEAADQSRFLTAGMTILKKPFSVDEFGRLIAVILQRSPGESGKPGH
ncbi:hybrid sensor histidine kinase/response regulator [Falsiroseomonas tokyonensis]|uniref:histidine kinase n=1 Tax=Falsiroseomonas tokyonensis TaxID=430521 RepID=A0ABV7C1T5_9PROT|nr:PAS domain-containing sensor histidine kinase [Falsiroseomonas tokyonensis]MBU8540627.1 PAS domain-containing protein [Falsiroseomonas tokyonensis]